MNYYKVPIKSILNKYSIFGFYPRRFLNPSPIPYTMTCEVVLVVYSGLVHSICTSRLMTREFIIVYIITHFLNTTTRIKSVCLYVANRSLL